MVSSIVSNAGGSYNKRGNGTGLITGKAGLQMVIRGGTILTPFEILRGKELLINGEWITGIEKEQGTSSGGDVLDAAGCLICPGFIDLHTHGGGGGDFMDDSDEAFETALQFHAQNGTTSVLPTSVTAPPADILRMFSRARRFRDRKETGCRVLGVHVEGPFLSQKNKGAQKEQDLLEPDRDGYGFLLDNADIAVRVTLSPELPGAEQMTRELTRRGVLVSGGHDNGRSEEILPVVAAGMRHLTHHFCAMSQASIVNGIRSVGLTELGLVDERLTLELIADGHHLPPEMVRLAYRCKGAEKVCLVSDSLRAGGMPEGDALYILGPKGQEAPQLFLVEDGVAKLPDRSRFAGSVQPLSRMVRNLVEDCGIPLIDAVRMASETPARILGVSGEMGSLLPGMRADICILGPDLSPVGVLIGGRLLDGSRPGRERHAPGSSRRLRSPGE